MVDKETDLTETSSPNEKVLKVEVAGRSFSLNTLLYALVGVVLLSGPLLFGSYYMNVLTRALILSIFSLSIGIIWGYGGILSFGHAAFFGLGAYVMGKILIAGIIGAGYVGILLGTLLPGAAGLIIAGILFYRDVSENTFVIITLAIAVIAQQIAVSWDSVTGGYNGLIGVPPLEIGIPLVAMLPLDNFTIYYITIVLVYLAYRFSKRMIRSPFGTVLIAIRENETKARSLGYDLTKYKMFAFGVACAMAGFAGTMYTAQIQFVSPNLVGFILSTQVILWTLVGGRGTLVGPILGTVFLVLFESIVSGVFQFGWTLLVGILLVVIVLAFPSGLIQLMQSIKTRITTWANPS